MASLVDRLIGRDGHRCAWCGRGLKRNIGPVAGGGVIFATADHVIPRALGGRDDLWNLLLACNVCNNKRGTTPVDVFRDYCRIDGMNVQESLIAAAIERVEQRGRKSRRIKRPPPAKRVRYPANACPLCGGALLVKSGVSRQCMFCHAFC